MSDLAPFLVVGETYTLNANTTSTQHIYLAESGVTWSFGTSVIVTEEMLNSMVLFYSHEYGVKNTISEIMINIGSKPLPYEPYKEPQTHIIPYVLRKGDYVDFAKGKLVRKSYPRNLSDFDWIPNGASEIDDGFVYYAESTGINTDSLITHFKPTEKGGSWNGLMIGECDVKGVYVLICTNHQTVDELKAWMMSENVEMLYESTEPIETDITDTLNIHTNYPTTTIISNAEVEVEYVADTKNYINNKLGTS